jgi:hypothetical protein
LALNSREYPVSSFFLSILHFLSIFSLVILLSWSSFPTCEFVSSPLVISLYIFILLGLFHSLSSSLNVEFLRLFSFLYMFSILRSRIFFLSFFLSFLTC